MDPIVTFVLGAGGVVGMKSLEVGADFLRRIYGPELDVIGKERAERRLRRILETSAMANDMVMDLPLQVPPDRVIEPIFTGAGNEDDPYLQEKWAALMARAATGAWVLPAYAEILRQLVPRQAHILDVLYDAPNHHMANAYLDDALNRRGMPTGMGTLSLLINDLHRLQVASSTQPVRLEEGRAWTQPEMHENAYLTYLGLSFVSSCQPLKRDT